MSLAIATPMYGNMCFGVYHKSMLNLHRDLVKSDYPFNIMTGFNESLIDRARNNMAEDFLQSKYKKLLFIDADIEFTNEDVAKLLEMDELVATGVYTCKKPEQDMYAAWYQGKLVTDLNDFDQEIVSVDYAGTGFMMIDREVFIMMQTKYPELENRSDPTEKWGYFNRMQSDGVMLSEDYAFCKRVKDMGIPIKMHTGVKLIHHGTYPYGRKAKVNSELR